MAIVKANYVKRGREARSGAKAHIRYITHRPRENGERHARALFGFDGTLTKAQAYGMIDNARRGTYFYRLKLSPDPKQEDRFRDLALQELTLDTMLRLEKCLGKHIAFAASIHDDHSPYRHVHALVLVHGRRLTRGDFAALRREATERALRERRIRDQALGLTRETHRITTARVLYHRYPPRVRRASRGRMRRYDGYTCGLCGYHQFAPFISGGYRCPLDGLYLRRDTGLGYAKSQREVGRQLRL
jgi:hypothetical protein